MTVKNIVDLSVVIVTYKSKEFILRCIQYIHEAAQGLSLEIIIVDTVQKMAFLTWFGLIFPPSL